MSLRNFFNLLRKNAKNRTFVFILIGAFLFICLVRISHAQEPGSGLYRIDAGQVSVDGHSVSGYSIGSLWGDYAQKTFEKKGFVVRVVPGASWPLYFSTSKSTVGFPDLASSTQAVDLTVTYPGRTQLAISSGGPLQSLDGTKIPDTTCDPAVFCEGARSGSWSRNSTYGFGYSLDGKYFRPFKKSAFIFPDFVQQNPKKKTQIFLKINPAPNTPKKTYQTIINLVTSISF